MSKMHGICGVRLALSATLDCCRRTAGRYWRGVRGIVRSVTDGRSRDRQLEQARLNKIRDPLRTDFCGERIELKELIKVLSIGDRIRVLCDDGVLVAEKISQTQFKLIHAQMMSKFVH